MPSTGAGVAAAPTVALPLGPEDVFALAAERRRIKPRLLKEHYNQEHRAPERCPKCGQRGRGVVMRHWNRCM